MKFKAALVIAAFFSILLLARSARADTEAVPNLAIVNSDAVGAYKYALNLFDQQKFEDASAAFETAITYKPEWDLPHFYKAICRLREGQLIEAEATFRLFIRQFPDSNLIPVCQKALSQISELEEAQSKIPAKCVIPLTLSSQRVETAAVVNGTPVDALLDSGTNRVIMTKPFAEKLHLKLGKPDGYYKPTGKSIWHIRATISLGAISRVDFPITVMEPSERYHYSRGYFDGNTKNVFPDYDLLIGDDFFKGYPHRVLNLRKQTYTVFRDVTGTPTGGKIQCIKDGSRILMPVKIDGKATEAILDTGYNSCISITDSQCNKIGYSFSPFVIRTMSHGLEICFRVWTLAVCVSRASKLLCGIVAAIYPRHSLIL